MVTASDTMSADAVRALTGDSLVDVARTLRDRGLSTLPVCDDAEVLVAMLTDRDLVVGPMAQGADPRRRTSGTWGSRRRSRFRPMPPPRTRSRS